MRTFYEDRIPSYGHLENVFKLSVLVCNHAQRTLYNKRHSSPR